MNNIALSSSKSAQVRSSIPNCERSFLVLLTCFVPIKKIILLLFYKIAINNTFLVSSLCCNWDQPTAPRHSVLTSHSIQYTRAQFYAFKSWTTIIHTHKKINFISIPKKTLIIIQNSCLPLAGSSLYLQRVYQNRAYLQNSTIQSLTYFMLLVIIITCKTLTNLNHLFMSFEAFFLCYIIHKRNYVIFVYGLKKCKLDFEWMKWK